MAGPSSTPTEPVVSNFATVTAPSPRIGVTYTPPLASDSHSANLRGEFVRPQDRFAVSRELGHRAMNPVDARSSFSSKKEDRAGAIGRQGTEPVKQPLAIVETKYEIGCGGREKA